MTQENYGSCHSSSSPKDAQPPSLTLMMMPEMTTSNARNLKQQGAVLLVSALVLLVASVAVFGSHQATPSLAYRFLVMNRKSAHHRHHHHHLPHQAAAATAALRKLDAKSDDPNVLNIHVVPHTHDDVGWLKTVEQYYYGQNMSIQDACVQDIIDTVIDSLLESPTRTFTYVEQKFFSMWWNDQNDATKDSVRFLVANQQLSFVNGGWCMHDEASVHFMGMIDQTTLGHDFLKRELGVVPKVGWQLDPFGHSATQASLLTARVGFDALYFGRIDYQDLQIRHETQECEGLWAASQAAGEQEAVFWGLTGSYSGNYEAPSGFCFDKRCHDERLTNITRTELVKKVNLFLTELKVQSDRTKGNHIMVTMGSDFNYQRASVYFANLDLLMSSIDTFQQWNLVNVSSIVGPRFKEVNIFYSSPDYYTKMKYEESKVSDKAKAHDKASHHHFHHRSDQTSNLNMRQTRQTSNKVQWNVKKDDFFPYSDCAHCFWTGYFTSRTAFKRLERVGSSFLLAARQIESMPEAKNSSKKEQSHLCTSTGQRCDCCQPLFELEDALGVVQHHDAVSGTAKQHVSDDYSKRVQSGINKASEYVANKLKRVLAKQAGGTKLLDNLSYCQLINETICDVSQSATEQDGVDMYVVVYNPLGSNKSSIVRLPVSVDSPFEVKKLGSDPLTSASVVRPVPSPFVESLASTPSAKFVLIFDTGPLQPVGATVFRIKPTAGIDSNQRGSSSEDFDYRSSKQDRRARRSEHDIMDDPDVIVVSNEMVSVKFDRVTGAMVSITANEATLPVSQSWGYYTSFDSKIDKPGDNTSRADQNSGAYVFRPNVPGQSLQTIGYLANAAQFVNTSVGMEIRVEFEEPWVKQVTRVMRGLPYVEVEYTIGPIPIDDGRGKEIVTRLSTPIESNATFFTDSNGREFLERRRDYRPSWPMEVFEPVAGNYYPINAAIYIEDEVTSLSVLLDRTQGGSSLMDGSIELMAQRRTLVDDARGVDEPMNETDGGVTPYPPYGSATRWGEGVVVRGTYRIIVGKGRVGASLARAEMDTAFASPMIFVASSPSGTDEPPIQATHSALTQALPPNIMLVTFKKLEHSEYLIRLGHQYGVKEDKVLSQDVSMDLSTLFSGFKVVSAREQTLSGNQGWNDWVKKRLDWTGLGSLSKSPVYDGNTAVSLKPMEVRTFILKLEPL